MILAIITAVLAYRRAVDAGRRGWLWAIAGAATFIGAQLGVTFAFGVLLGLGVEVFALPETIYDDYAIFISILAIIASIAASWFLLKYLERRPVESTAYVPPPPPPSFSGE